MKRFAFLLAAVVLFTPACNGGDPTNPSNQPLRFTADLRAANEVPPVTNADSSATGTMNLTIEVTRDAAGTITAVNSSSFDVVMAAFPGGTVLTGAHIHPGAAGATGGVAINTGLQNGEITLPANGSGSFTKSPSPPISVEQAQNLMNTPQSFYFNVHTQLNTSGAIRGQLVRIQ
jgi:hypothetical protein